MFCKYYNDEWTRVGTEGYIPRKHWACEHEGFSCNEVIHMKIDACKRKRVEKAVAGLCTDTPKQATTRLCPVCGNRDLIEYTSLNQKVCTNHERHVIIPWYLEEGQESLL